MTRCQFRVHPVPATGSGLLILPATADTVAWTNRAPNSAAISGRG